MFQKKAKESERKKHKAKAPTTDKELEKRAAWIAIRCATAAGQVRREANWNKRIMTWRYGDDKYYINEYWATLLLYLVFLHCTWGCLHIPEVLILLLHFSYMYMICLFHMYHIMDFYYFSSTYTMYSCSISDQASGCLVLSTIF